MKTAKIQQARASEADGKGKKVRTAIAQMLSSEERGKESDRDDAPGTLSSRDPVPTSSGTPAEIAAQDRLTEIEQQVGKLVNDVEIEQDAAAHTPKS